MCMTSDCFGDYAVVTEVPRAIKLQPHRVNRRFLRARSKSRTNAQIHYLRSVRQMSSQEPCFATQSLDAPMTCLTPVLWLCIVYSAPRPLSSRVMARE